MESQEITHALVWRLPEYQEMYVNINQIEQFQPKHKTDFDRAKQYAINGDNTSERYRACILLLAGKLKQC